MLKKQRGFTLIELMVSIVIMAVTVSVAVPVMQLMQANSRMSSAANDLATDLKRGRSEAVAKRNIFTVSPQSGGWSNGWKATTPLSTSALENATSTNILALEKIKLPTGVTITQSVFPLLFNGTTGRVTNSAGDSVDVTFKVCSSTVSTEEGFDVLLNRFGRVFIRRHTNASDCNP